MRTLKKYWAVLMLTCLALSLAGTEKAIAQVGTSVSFQTFYDELAPYGRWINYPGHGYVWAPDVEPGFQPYGTRGHWVMTEYGNTWVSDYVWGWAPFHYGRWLWDDYIGWVWVPGNEWGPAWVNWRSGANYYGWAPMGPGMHINVFINIPVAHWVFVPRRHIMSRRVYNYCLPRTTVVNVYNNTTIINNYYNNNSRTYVYGPRAQEIQQHTRSRVPVYRVNQDNRPGRAVVDKGSVRMYRPEVANQQNEAPSRVISRENYNRQDGAGTGRDSYQPRTERSSDTGSRGAPAREAYTENSGNATRQSLTDSRRSTGRDGDNAASAPATRTNISEGRSNPAREGILEGRSNTQGTEFVRPREVTNSRMDAILREPGSNGSAPERVVRERPDGLQTSPERPAREMPARREAPVTREMPATREAPQQERRSQLNQGLRQEQPTANPIQRSVPATARPERTQSSQPQNVQQSRPTQPQRQQRATQSQPQRQESAPTGETGRRIRR